MATNILMPALSPTMTEGTLARWLKAEGDAIRAGDVIAEIETDKATMEVEAVDDGVLGRILVADGTQNVKVNDAIAILIEAGEQAPAKAAGASKRGGAVASAAGGKAPDAATATVAAGVDGPAGAAQAVVQDGGETGAAVQSAKAPAAAAITAAGDTSAPNGHDRGERIFASPLAKRMARQAGIDLGGITGTGPNGRIVRADIENRQTGAAAPAAPAAPASPPPSAARGPALPITAPHQAMPFNNIRKITARRLVEAKQTIPHFYVSIDVELDALLRLRTDLNGKSPKEGVGAFKLSVNDLLIKAAAVTLRRVPNVNASYTDDALILYDDVDISVAVSIPDGLITPIIRQADRKGLAAISNEARSLIERARAGKLKPQEFQGGSFSISNMGMYGVNEFAAIINPPQAAILAIAAGQPRPVVRAGALTVATVMTVTLSVDHRVIDGALAAEWVSTFKRVVEDPLTLML